MAEHFLSANPETVAWGYFDAARPAVLTVESGDTVTFDTLSGEPEDMPPADDPRFPVLDGHLEVHAQCERGRGPHFLTGPVWVKGAEPGDVLEVKILDYRLRQPWGWNLIIPLMGSLPKEFPNLRLMHVPVDLEAGTMDLPWGKTLPLNPFFGVMGVAPPASYGRISTEEPREHGGNFDNKELVQGTTLYLPVWNEGALFSVGDGHGAQGDGEVCQTALETCMTGTFKFTVRKDMSLKMPRAENDTSLITMGFHEDLDTACRIALSDMLSWIQERADLSREDAYSLCSLTADMRVTQLVNKQKGIHIVIKKSAL